MVPAIFLSHGAPTLPLIDAPARDFLRGLGKDIGRPRAILVASAHWETPAPTVSSAEHPATIHDFYGFPRALYDLRYEPPGAPDIAAAAAGLLNRAGLSIGLDPVRGLDHGAWVPLLLMYPDADIPVLQISIQPPLGPRHHLAVGKALAALRQQEVLIVGSGSFTHNLSRFRGAAVNAPAPPDVVAFADWFDAAIIGRRTADTLHYRALAPHAVEQHPTDEHLLPLFVAMGAGGTAAQFGDACDSEDGRVRVPVETGARMPRSDLEDHPQCAPRSRFGTEFNKALRHRLDCLRKPCRLCLACLSESTCQRIKIDQQDIEMVERRLQAIRKTKKVPLDRT
jgi:4,5-DOPA dioxygenase extradiol